MNYSLMALGLLILIPATLQAAQSARQPVTSGAVRFVGNITAPACTIKYQHEDLVSKCFGVASTQSKGHITTTLNNMPSELVSNVITEMVNNNKQLKNVTISYK